MHQVFTSDRIGVIVGRELADRGLVAVLIHAEPAILKPAVIFRLTDRGIIHDGCDRFTCLGRGFGEVHRTVEL